MADIINFNKARKQKERADAARQAAANRAKSGRTAGQKAREEAEAEAARRKLDHLRRDRDGEQDPPD